MSFTVLLYVASKIITLLPKTLDENLKGLLMLQLQNCLHDVIFTHLVS